ncbi:MAG: hypothetical protein V3T81_10040 [Thermoanaerobaculia bacterium]
MSSTTSARVTAQLERKLGRYLTSRELNFVQQGGTSEEGGLTRAELRAVKRIWPGMQLEFKLEKNRGSS